MPMCFGPVNHCFRVKDKRHDRGRNRPYYDGLSARNKHRTVSGMHEHE